MHGRVFSGESGITALVLTACAPEYPDQPAGEARVVLHALAPSTVAALRLEVTGPGLPEPVSVHIPVDLDRSARGHVKVPPGAVRRIAIEAMDAKGVATHRGAVSMPLLPGGNAPVHVMLARV